MDLDLTKLDTMHPLLAPSTVADYLLKVAIGLGRQGHEPGALLIVSLDDELTDAKLNWVQSDPGTANRLDWHRITEDAAEAITLALVYEANGWVVRRRMQRGEFADWLLIDKNRGLVALEVSGVDKRDDKGRRLREKLEQLSRCELGRRAACVVELSPPRSCLANAIEHNGD
ncbi:hypothetical protein ACQR16_32915 [Bradyrhizobium oligotrophicum]|uniref:hypothetical protein n=1 Tax=Bradyrhizobium oligotrophicum TaxID=44255 RepID=UPI003EBFE8E3